MLFRYSALTFNGHRIHYDRRYVTEVEGYPGLVVHGPLIATLLLDLLRREMPEADVSRFQFKAIRPLFDLDTFFRSGGLGAGTCALGAITKDSSPWTRQQSCDDDSIMRPLDGVTVVSLEHLLSFYESGRSQVSVRVPSDGVGRFPAVVRAADILLAVTREAA